MKMRIEQRNYLKEGSCIISGVKKSRIRRLFWLSLSLVSLFLCGCNLHSVQEPITLTVWHVYGGQTDSPLNALIEEFNESVGKKEGIRIQVSGVSNTNNIHEAVLQAANKEPGAAALPDLFISYPKTILAMPDASILVDYHDYFTEEELENFIPEFLEEGEIENRLVILPTAKSTEIMFVDKTLFDRFSKETGAEMDHLQTWEGLFRMAEQYYEWSGGKTFFVHDYWFNYFQVGVTSLGYEFFDGEDINYGVGFQSAFNSMADAAVKGALWMHDGYATEPLRTGDAVVSVASSASVLYYEDQITYADNRSESIEVIAMPIPHFENGEKLVMQRGAGFCTLKSTPEREKAAVTFLKWLTIPENNLRFVTNAGYMPVTKKAFEQLPDLVEKMENAKYKSLYQAFMETQRDYHFYVAPQLASYLSKETAFERGIRLIFKEAYTKLREGITTETLKKEAFETLKDLTAE